MRKIEDLTGKVFGNLTVLNRVACKGKIKWLCKCECGNTTVVYRDNLVYGRTKSCGCLKRKSCEDEVSQYVRKIGVISLYILDTNNKDTPLYNKLISAIEKMYNSIKE